MAALRLLHIQLNPCAISNRALAKVAEHVGMEQNVRTTLIGNHEPESLYGIKPFNTSFYSANIVFVSCHSVLPNSLHPQDRV